MLLTHRFLSYYKWSVRWGQRKVRMMYYSNAFHLNNTFLCSTFTYSTLLHSLSLSSSVFPFFFLANFPFLGLTSENLKPRENGYWIKDNLDVVEKYSIISPCYGRVLLVDVSLAMDLNSYPLTLHCALNKSQKMENKIRKVYKYFMSNAAKWKLRTESWKLTQIRFLFWHILLHFR